MRGDSLTRYFPPYPELADAVRIAFAHEILELWYGREIPLIVWAFLEGVGILIETKPCEA